MLCNACYHRGMYNIMITKNKNVHKNRELNTIIVLWLQLQLGSHINIYSVC